MDEPGDWIPDGDTITAMTKCRFDNCNTKKIKSVHVYMKNISVTTWYDSDQSKQLVNGPGDTYIYTYAEQRNTSVGAAHNEGSFIRTQGLTKKLYRNQANYHSVLKANCYSRNTTPESLNDLQAMTWKHFTQKMDFFNKTGTSDETGQVPRLNIDWKLNVDTPYVPPEANTKFFAKVEFDLCVATKWRLYGTKP